MKKFICILLAVIMVSSLVACGGSTLKYPIGPDTRQVFGDGTFQTGGATKENTCLSFEKYNVIMIQNIQEIYEEGDKVYFFGHEFRNHEATNYNIYAIISLEEGKIWYCTDHKSIADKERKVRKEEEMIANGDMVRITDLSGFSEEDRAIFEMMVENHQCSVPGQE